ncbi:hypothetical protein GCM10027515_21770 [Schumannella luteola]|uniref:Uncharacterized protein n=1 Tax=Schumannella luteola TaxID=472059 RepID=A0A852YJ95_9MICO|nr:hypothetical protein [Schumannella luteola]NYH00028.1 hypothetical protein [Schumannella luteola]TPX06587.1 hypothetical protein FJ656_00080 [Schumannella luteola]
MPEKKDTDVTIAAARSVAEKMTKRITERHGKIEKIATTPKPGSTVDLKTGRLKPIHVPHSVDGVVVVVEIIRKKQ